MPVVRYRTARAFLGSTLPFLEQNEALNTLVLSVAAAAGEAGGALSYQAAVEVGGETVAAALLGDGATLLVARSTPEAAEILAADCAEAGIAALQGVRGAGAAATAFASGWIARRGGSWRVEMRQRAYQLFAVEPPPPTPGRLRRFTSDELDQLAEWSDAFAVDAGLPPGDGRARAAAQLAAGRAFAWDDDGPAAMAVRARDTRRSASINAVYTPPARRGRGYASACVAALSQLILAGGKDMCCLFTDLDNPTSNRIYQRIGYQPAGDFADIRLVPAFIRPG